MFLNYLCIINNNNNNIIRLQLLIPKARYSEGPLIRRLNFDNPKMKKGYYLLLFRRFDIQKYIIPKVCESEIEKGFIIQKVR